MFDFGLIENNSIDQNLDLGLVDHRFSKQEALKQKEAVMAKVNLSHLKLSQKVFELSGGEAQRVALAKLFLKNPPIILADEPTASLDADNAQEVMDLLKSLATSERVIVVATHSPDIWKQADEVIKLGER